MAIEKILHLSIKHISKHDEDMLEEDWLATLEPGELDEVPDPERPIRAMPERTHDEELSFSDDDDDDDNLEDFYTPAKEPRDICYYRSYTAWFILIDCFDGEDCEEFGFDSLGTVFDYAKEQGCSAILFEKDAELIPTLPIYKPYEQEELLGH